MKIFILYIAALTLIVSMTYPKDKNNDVIIDSDMTFDEAIAGTKAPKSVIDSLCLLDVEYFSFEGKIHKGQLVINKAVRDDIEQIFKLMLKEKFPIAKAIPIVKYKWSDDASMEDNNTSAFNYRVIAGTNRMSNHSYGRAIDINPFYNPVIHNDGRISPKGAKYDIKRSGTFSANQFIVKEFIKRGWRWGGTFSTYRDNHHFDKEK